MVAGTRKPKIEPYEGNMAIVKLAYSEQFILPYEDAVTLMKCLEKAEQFRDSYGEEPSISPIEYNQITITPLSKKRYLEIKMNQLMGIKEPE